MEEQGVLFEIREEGQVLKLVDDRKLQVAPEDVSTATTWFPTMGLTITTENDGVFPLKVRNTVTGQAIAATWLS